MKGFWLFLFGAICGIAGTVWYLQWSTLPDVFASLRGVPAVVVRTGEHTEPLPACPPVEVATPAPADDSAKPHCDPWPMTGVATPAPWTVGALPTVAPASKATTPDAAPEPDTAVATEPVPSPTAGQLTSPQVETATAPAAAAAPAVAQDSPAEQAMTPDPVASGPVPPTGPEAEASAVPTPIADSYQAHPDALLVPVTGVTPEQLSDTFDDLRGGERRHEAIDIMAPKGTPVVAVDDGEVVKLFNSVRGGLTVYQYDSSEKLAYYYGHLDSYAPGIAEGKVLKRGELIGQVGVTGNSAPDAPHLHFAVFELGAEKQWWKGTAINPYPMFKR